MSETRVPRYIVRQYRPAYFSGFDNEIIPDVLYDKLTEVSLCENFKRPGFKKFTISPYSGELIIEAHYDDGTHWVAGFATEVGSKMARNWRYTGEAPT